tara:strand:+ start:134 stop:598 length:465 start_codon:yes stop_codon:yes gene_type:complete
MKNNINSGQSTMENGFMAKPNISLDYTKQDKITLADKKISIGKEKFIENSNVVKLAEQVKAENKINAQQKQETSEADINKALEVVSSFINSTQKQVNFSHDNSSGRMIITVTDKDTQEVINQFPSEKIVSMAEKIKELQQDVESISGLLIDSRV